MAQLPKVQLTAAFAADLEHMGIPPALFAEGFAQWKALNSSAQLRDPYYGKDGPYARPVRGGGPVLRHVHMRPESDRAATLAWDSKARAAVPKTSDAVLIYAQHPTAGYLLIHAVWAVGAHDFAEMRTPEDMVFMNNMADIAYEFIFWGKVIV